MPRQNPLVQLRESKKIATVLFGVFIFLFVLYAASQRQEPEEPYTPPVLHVPRPESIPPPVELASETEDEVLEKKRVYARKQWAQDEAGACRLWTEGRDLNKKPLTIVRSGFSKRQTQCDIPCNYAAHDDHADAFQHFVIIGGNIPSKLSCPSFQKKVFFSMENNDHRRMLDEYDITGTTDLESDVPVQYPSWAEYDFLTPVQPKTRTALAAAFISNCGPQERLKVIAELQQNGVGIDSYGTCMHNTPGHDSKHDFLRGKNEKMASYKFCLGFENSRSRGYRTEKLFGCFVSGSVPLYLGAPNIKPFGPSAHSIIEIDDFKDVKELANYLKYLDRNDTAYNEYLTWKERGYSADFVEMVDLANVHSECRLCIRVADMFRREGVFDTKSPYEAEEIKNRPEGKWALSLKVRPRGSFWFKTIYFESMHEVTLSRLWAKTRDRWGSQVFNSSMIEYHFYRLPVEPNFRGEKLYFKKDTQLKQHLAEEDELEFVLINKQHVDPATLPSTSAMMGNWVKLDSHIRSGLRGGGLN